MRLEMDNRQSKKQVLNNLHRVAADLQQLLRSRVPLTEGEQLFIENRLMIMQLQYQQWAKRKDLGKHYDAA